MKLILRWTRRALAVSAFVLLGYSAFVVLDSWSFQGAEDRRLEQALAPPPQTAGRVVLASLSPAQTGGLIGRMEIPRLGLSVIVMEGTSTGTLRHAVGHIAGTVLPGQLGNTGISGHRDTFFRPLRNIKANDLITLRTAAGEYRYRVTATSVVDPDDVAVLDNGENEALTLVTCYPFYFVGPAPKRFIVRAERMAR
jgi:sortase A